MSENREAILHSARHIYPTLGAVPETTAEINAQEGMTATENSTSQPQ